MLIILINNLTTKVKQTKDALTKQETVVTRYKAQWYYKDSKYTHDNDKTMVTAFLPNSAFMIIKLLIMYY